MRTNRSAVLTSATAGVLTAAVLIAGAGCGGAADPTMPTVEGEFGAKPAVTFPDMDPPGETKVKVVTPGDGPAITKDDVVIADVAVMVWESGEDFLNTYDTKQPTTITMGGEHVSTSWDKALIGQSTGSRVALVSPATTGFGPNGMAPAGVKPTETLLVVFDIHGGYAPNASVARERTTAAVVADPSSGPRGVEVAAEYGELPTIELDRADGPSARKPPAQVSVTRLHTGEGSKARLGSRVVVQYSGFDWRTGKVFDSSYQRNAPNGFRLEPKAVPKSWLSALDGLPAGSRVAVLAPAAAGGSASATSGGLTVPPETPVIWVIDLIDVLGS